MRVKATYLINICGSSVANDVKTKESGKRIPPTRESTRAFFLLQRFTTMGENTEETDQENGPNQSEILKKKTLFIVNSKWRSITIMSKVAN